MSSLCSQLKPEKFYGMVRSHSCGLVLRGGHDRFHHVAIIIMFQLASVCAEEDYGLK